MTEPISHRWPGPGHWRFEDYLCLPDDRKRYEVLRGCLYVTTTPDFNHQFAVSRLLSLLGTFADRHRLGILLVGPFAIRLPRRLADPAAPDLIFFRDGNEPHSGAEF